MDTNKKYSYKAFPYHGLSFKDRPAEEFNNTEIIGSCFFQSWKEDDVEVVKDIFPDGMIGVVFKKCNLDNIHVSTGNTVITEGKERCTHLKVRMMNDLADWILDDELKPVEPLNKECYQEFSLSMDPKDIPKEKMEECVFIKKEREIHEATIGGIE